MLRFIAVLLGLFVLFSESAQSGTYYVAPLGTLPAGTPDGTEGKPFLSIDQAFTSGKVKGGDTLLLKDGDYGAVTIKTKAAFDVPVTIMSQNTKAAHFDSIVLAQDTRNLILRNLSVWPRDPAKGLNYLVRAYDTTSDITIDGLDVRSEKGAKNYMKWDAAKWEARKFSGILLQGPRGKVINNQLTGVYHGIIVAINSQIVSNTIAGFNGDGMRASSDSLVRYNRVYDCVKTDENHDDGFQAIASVTSPIKNLVLDGNIIIEWTGDINHSLRGQLQGIGLFDGFYDNVKIVNNLVVSSTYHGISIYGGRQARITNNTVVHSKGYTLVYPYIAVRPHKNGTPSTDVLVANNAAMSFQGMASPMYRVEFRNNSVIGTPSLVFENPAAFDYRPKASSGYIDTADPTVAPVEDVLGKKRPGGALPDRGAYEVQLGNPLVDPTGTPTKDGTTKTTTGRWKPRISTSPGGFKTITLVPLN